MGDDYWVTASVWARKRFRCDYPGCEERVRRILVRVGSEQSGYCYAHATESKQQPNPVPTKEAKT